MNELLQRLCSPDGFDVDEVLQIIERLPLDQLNETVNLDEYRELVKRSAEEHFQAEIKERGERIQAAPTPAKAFEKSSVDKRATPKKNDPSTPSSLQASPLPARVRFKSPLHDIRYITSEEDALLLATPSDRKLKPSKTQQQKSPDRDVATPQRFSILNSPRVGKTRVQAAIAMDSLPESPLPKSSQPTALLSPEDNTTDDPGALPVPTFHLPGLPDLESCVEQATALHLAVLLQKKPIVDALLKKGIQINSQNDVGMTPFHYALRLLFNPDNHYPHRHLYQIIDLLLDYGADMTIPDEHGHTVLDDVLLNLEIYPDRAKHISFKIKKFFENLLELNVFSPSEDECYGDVFAITMHSRHPLLTSSDFSLSELAEKKYRYYSKARNTLKKLNLMVVVIGIIGAVVGLYYSLASLWRYFKEDVISDISNQLPSSLQGSTFSKPSLSSIAVPLVPSTLAGKTALWGYHCYKQIQNKSWFETSYEEIAKEQAVHKTKIDQAIKTRHPAEPSLR